MLTALVQLVFLYAHLCIKVFASTSISMQIELWERKIQLLRETRSAVDSEREDIDMMKAVIHNKEVNTVLVDGEYCNDCHSIANIFDFFFVFVLNAKAEKYKNQS